MTYAVDFVSHDFTIQFVQFRGQDSDQDAVDCQPARTHGNRGRRRASRSVSGHGTPRQMPGGPCAGQRGGCCLRRATGAEVAGKASRPRVWGSLVEGAGSALPARCRVHGAEVASIVLRARRRRRWAGSSQHRPREQARTVIQPFGVHLRQVMTAAADFPAAAVPAERPSRPSCSAAEVAVIRH